MNNYQRIYDLITEADTKDTPTVGQKVSAMAKKIARTIKVVTKRRGRQVLPKHRGQGDSGPKTQAGARALGDYEGRGDA